MHNGLSTDDDLTEVERKELQRRVTEVFEDALSSYAANGGSLVDHFARQLYQAAIYLIDGRNEASDPGLQRVLDTRAIY